VRAVLLGVAAANAVTLVYGVLSEPFEFSLGLLVVGFAGGWLIGSAVAYGAWSGREHETVRAVRWFAAVLAVAAGLAALFLAYTISQALLPQASTSVASRLSPSGFIDYLSGLDLVRIIHVVALALMAFMASRAAR